MARTLHLTNPLMSGNDVRHVQGLLISAGFPVSLDGVFGPESAEACRDYKYEHGWPDGKLYRSCGRLLLGALEGKQLPDDYARRALNRKKHGGLEQRARGRITDFFKWGIAHEPEIHYAQERPMNLAPKGMFPSLPWRADCSEFYTQACKYAGVKDPNGQDYDGTGFTGTLISGMRHVTRAMAKPGDAVVFGLFPGHHVAGLLDPGSQADPALCSHGQEAGPNRITFSAEYAYQAGHGHTVLYWLSPFKKGV